VTQMVRVLVYRNDSKECDAVDKVALLWNTMRPVQPCIQWIPGQGQLYLFTFTFTGTFSSCRRVYHASRIFVHCSEK